MGEREQLERNLVERFASVMEQAGLQPMAGRILGRLLMCTPPEQSSQELSDWLDASRGSISTQTQMLVRAGFLERIRKPGSRATWYRLRNDVWSDLLTLEVVRTRQLHEITVEAARFKATLGEPLDDRLGGFRAFCEFFLDRLPSLIEEWRAHRREGGV